MKQSRIYTIAICCLLAIATVQPAALAQKSKSGRTTSVKKTNKKTISTTPGQYPESSERLLIEKDVEHVTPWGLKVMMNEIYARHGYVFTDATLKKHFRKEKWYKGKERKMKNIKLTDTEVQNIAFIKQHQNKAKQ
jgi:hypothetical protein